MKKPLKLEELENGYKKALLKLIEVKLASKEVLVSEGNKLFLFASGKRSR